MCNLYSLNKKSGYGGAVLSRLAQPRGRVQTDWGHLPAAHRACGTLCRSSEDQCVSQLDTTKRRIEVRESDGRTRLPARSFQFHPSPAPPPNVLASRLLASPEPEWRRADQARPSGRQILAFAAEPQQTAVELMAKPASHGVPRPECANDARCDDVGREIVTMSWGFMLLQKGRDWLFTFTPDPSGGTKTVSMDGDGGKVWASLR